MTDDDAATNDELELARIVEAFEEARRGLDRPSVEQWIERHPRFADDLAELLPGVVLMESVAGQASAAALRRESTEPLPESIGEYAVLGRLGRGGMGVVYLARQESLGREVALKVLPTNLEVDGGFLDRFRREAQVAARLSHPHIVPVYGVGFADGRHFFAMKYVDGFSLDAVLRAMRYADASAASRNGSSSTHRRESSGASSAAGSTGEISGVVRAMREAKGDGLSGEDAASAPVVPSRFTVRTAVGLALQVADALEHAHAAGVLHRDIKPGNVLLDAEGDAWVTDFGLCRIEEAGSLTSEGAVVGTLRYMAPEQVEGAADERSDVYSLGLVLYELLTSTPAFDSTRRARLVHDVLHTSPPRVRRLRPDVPRVVETIVLKATAKLPDERYPSAAALARDLRAFLENRPIQARPPSAFYLARLFVSRHRLATGVAVVAALLLATLAALYVRDLRESRTESERRAYVGDLVGAEAALRDGAIERAKRRLAAAPERFRAWEWEHLAARVDQTLRTVSLPAPWLTEVAPTPDGELLAVSAETGVFLVRADDGGVVADFRVDTARSLAWSQDGTALVCVFDDETVRVFEPDANGVFGETAQLDTLEAPVMVSFTGPLIVVGGGGGEVWIWDRPRSVVRWAGTLNGIVRAIGAFSDDPSGERWWAVTHRGSLATGRYSIEEQVDLDLGGDELVDAAMHPGRTEGVGVTGSGAVLSFSIDDPVPRLVHSTGSTLQAVTIDGDVAIAVGADKLLHMIDLASRRAYRELSGSSHKMNDVVALADEDVIVTTGMEGALRFWPRVVAGGGVRLEGHVHDVNGIAFSADGARIATSGRDGQVLVWDARTCEPTHRFVEPERPVGTVGFVRDGRGVVAAVSKGELYLWDLDEGTAGRGSLVHHVNLGDVTILDTEVDEAGGAVFFATSNGILRGDHSLELLDELWLPGVAVSNFDLDVARRVLVGVTVDGRAFAVDVDSGDTRYLVDHGREALGLGFALAPARGPAAGLAAYTNADHDVVVLRAETGAVETVISNRAPGQVRGERLMGVTFSPDGERVLATTRNGLLSVFAVGSWEHLIDLRGHVTWAMRVTRCEATGTIVSVSSDETARVWNSLSTRAWLDELEVDRFASDAPVSIADQLRRPAILESIWAELAASPEQLSRSSWTLISLMNSRDPGDPLTSALHALAFARKEGEMRAGIPAQLEFAARKLPADDPRQPELRRTIRKYQRSRLVADVTGFAPGVEPSDLLPKPSVQRTLLATISYFPWLPVGRLATAVTPWVSAGVRIREALAGR